MFPLQFPPADSWGRTCSELFPHLIIPLHHPPPPHGKDERTHDHEENACRRRAPELINRDQAACCKAYSGNHSLPTHVLLFLCLDFLILHFMVKKYVPFTRSVRSPGR